MPRQVLIHPSYEEVSFGLDKSSKKGKKCRTVSGENVQGGELVLEKMCKYLKAISFRGQLPLSQYHQDP